MLNDPLLLTTYSLLILAILSFWIYRRSFIWGSLIVASIILAFIAKILTPAGLLPILLLAGCHFGLNAKVKGPLRFMLTSLASVISIGLILHLFPGYNNWLIVKDLHVSTNAVPFTLYFNYDKPFIGIFILALHLPLLSSWAAWKRKLPLMGLWAGITIAVMLLASRAFNIVHIDPKIPMITLPWIIANLFLVCIPDEAFWRGFLQQKITNYLKPKTQWAPLIAIGILSVFFALMHLLFVFQARYIILAFIASALYGLSYHYTKSVEGAIASHFLLNVAQFFFFTYPALA